MNDSYMHTNSNRKINLLHQQIDDLTKQSADRTELIDKLQQISNNEEHRKLKLLEKYRFDPNQILPRPDLNKPSQTNTYFSPRLKDELKLNLGDLGDEDDRKNNLMLSNEMERLYGKPTARSYREMFDPKRVVADVINKRTQEFSQTQKGKVAENQALAIERFKLQEARDNIRHKRLALEHAVSPVGRAKSLPVEDDGQLENVAFKLPQMEREQARSVDSFIKQAKENYSENLDRIYELRKKVEDDYNEKWRPYRGEAGISTYDESQLRDYYKIRDVVDGYVDEELKTFLDGDGKILDPSARNALLEAEERHKLQLTLSTSEEKTVALMAEDILLESTSDETYNIAKEILHVIGTLKNSSDMLLMNVAEAASTDNPDGREIGDTLYDDVTKVYFDLQNQRNYKGKKGWSHNNSMQLATTDNIATSESLLDQLVKPETPVDKKQTGKNAKKRKKPIQPDDSDLVLDIHSIIPLNFRNNYIQPFYHSQQQFSHYVQKELEYIHNMVPSLFTLNIAKRCVGVEICRHSPDGNFLALATQKGDLIVYKTKSVPWQPVRAQLHANKQYNVITEMNWSDDSLLLLTIDDRGHLLIWKQKEHDLLSKKELKKLLKTVDKNMVVHKLHPLFSLIIDESNIQSQKDGIAIDLLNPDFSPRHAVISGSNYESNKCIVNVELENRNVTSYHISNDWHAENEQINKEENTEKAQSIQINEDQKYMTSSSILKHLDHDENNKHCQDITVHLLKEHELPLVWMGFVNRQKQHLVTVDEGGIVCLWTRSRSTRSTFGWYFPDKKIRLNLMKTAYAPVLLDEPKIVFADHKMKTESSKTADRKDVASWREEAEEKIKMSFLKSAYHVEYSKEQNLMMELYPPTPNVQHKCLFHIIKRYISNGQLASYSTRTFEPVKISCKKLVSVKQKADHKELILVLLFPEYPPKDAHLSVIMLNLEEMKLRDHILNLPLSSVDYEFVLGSNSVNCEIAEIGGAGRAVLFLTTHGVISCYSLNSGEKLLVVDNKNSPSLRGFKGCIVNKDSLSLPEKIEVTAFKSRKDIYAVLHAKNTRQMHVLCLEDKNEYEVKETILSLLSELESETTEMNTMAKENSQVTTVLEDHTDDEEVSRIDLFQVDGTEEEI